MKALLVIDMQGYFVNEKEIPGKIVSHIKKTKYEHIIFTRFVNNETTTFWQKRGWRGCSSGEDVKIVPLLRPYAKQVFTKHTFSILTNKKLVKYIKENKIDSFDICGVDINACVLLATFELFDRGYDIKVLNELTGSHNGKELEIAAKIIIKNNFEKYY